MQHIKIRKISSVLLVCALLLQISSAALFAVAAAPRLYHYIFDEQNEDGSFVQPYYTDENGRRMPSPQPSGVSAAEDTLPLTYDARTLDIITTPKYQSGSGSCWAFSTVSCMEKGAAPCELSNRCKTLPMWKDFYRLVNSFFDGITLADLSKNAAFESDYVI